MSIDVIMPQMGESVVEGTILKWLVHEGDRIEKEQPIVAISTDKIDTEVPSPVRGIIKKILYPEGKTLPVQTVIAQIEAVEAKEAVSGIGRTPTLETAKKVETIKAVTEAEKIEEVEKRYSPLVRKLAKEYNINLEEVKGHWRRRTSYQKGYYGLCSFETRYFCASCGRGRKEGFR